ncbi:sugar phosphate isomerase/epimerase [Microbacterium yannicii]|uniref:Sugar phosphate isomerase/epimerase n=1 Tax=Microbacterium yannicii TaxID=671622 RepID=A0ABP9MCZ8_9MICO|nr:TIM barrel protein [Microbacterium yannicii]MCO5952957.1 sugar phosphate isomerase/epimerase [Microbacterium yannicii]
MTGIRVGTDSTKLPGAFTHDAFWVIERVADLGLDGVFFRDILDLSRTLDVVEIADVTAAARERGLYLEAGAGKVNPFAMPEDPTTRGLGDGDWLAGMARKLEAAAGCGIREVWAATTNYQFRLRGMRACDRFRTDVTWPEQLAATAKVLGMLAPVVRDLGLHLNLETHEEISSFEVVRLVEEAGPDAFGITFDSANVVVRGEDPVAAARRVAAYTRQTHLRDVVLVPNEHGIGRLIAPIGEGVIDWDGMLSALASAPAQNYSIEGVFPGMREHLGTEMSLFVDDPQWRSSHVDLTDEELAWARRHCDAQSEEGALREERLRATVTDEVATAFIVDSAARLRRLVSARAPQPSAAA